MGKTDSKYRGHFNKYHKTMKFSEIILKDISYFTLSMKNYFRNGFKHKSILVHPHYPSRGSTIYKVGKKMNYNITNKPCKSIQFGVAWEYLTFREEFHLLKVLSKTKPVVNLYSRDISKIFIDGVHQEIFGYCTIVDPLTFKGKIVRKNDINAVHDGAILQGPLDTIEKGYIYQILIDNATPDDLVMDIRVPIVKEMLDFVYIKHRSISERFTNSTVTSTIAATNTLFSTEEIALINKYCAALKLEYGELDVLRNKDDNKIYVVDVNNTPQGPPANTSKTDGELVLSKIATALQSLTD